MIVYAAAVALLIFIYFTSIGFSTFIAFDKGFSTQLTLTLPLSSIVINDNPNGVIFVTLSLNKLYHLFFELSVVSAVVGLIILAVTRLIYSKETNNVFNGNNTLFKLLIPSSLLALGLLLVIPLPISIYFNNGYVIIVSNIGIAFSGVFLLLSALSILSIVKTYGKYNELTELAVEIELTESDTMPMDYGEVTEAS
ncbi:hypothetical protein Cmaq_1947 [Caldivirga maquilingensis IC-167]|uniref:Uncharacterized protein n=2 Tax=Caldivirga maquilingensis TaxID=76887 RepID=A8MBN0_CALMQ|nr:hypothetical protein Cmaq_1947 [Caldivirga maquilingensis IC-167]